MSQSPKAAAEYMPQLDGLRAIAVLLVCVHHWATGGFSLGIIGVQLFFVLSGFLITGILLNLRNLIDAGEQSWRYSLRQFYIRRFLRIFPLYYFCLFLFLAFDLFKIREMFLWHFLYLSNVYFFQRGQFSGQFSHFWSLAVEEQFYLFWPCLVLLASRARTWAVGLIGVSLALRVCFFAVGAGNFAQYGTLVFSNLDTLGMGALIAWTAKESGERKDWAMRRLGWAAPFCLVEMILARVFSSSSFWLALDPIAVGLLSAWLVWKASLGIPGIFGRFLEAPPLAFLGRISYGIYVWHMFAPALLRGLLRISGLPADMNHGLAGFFLCLLLTIAIATFTWKLFEKPINDLKRFFPYRRKAIQYKTRPLRVVSTP